MTADSYRKKTYTWVNVNKTPNASNIFARFFKLKLKREFIHALKQKDSFGIPACAFCPRETWPPRPHPTVLKRISLGNKFKLIN